MNTRKALVYAASVCMAMTMAILPIGNLAHAGPPETVTNSSSGKKVGTMGTVKQKVDLNLQRADAAKRLKVQRSATAADAAKKTDATKKTEGGAK